MTMMTGEELTQLLEEVAKSFPYGADMLRAHIAALEAERGEAKQEAADDRASLESVLAERAALRERVQALEAECVRLQEYDRDVRLGQIRDAEERAEYTESRLAAIRQQAWSDESLAAIAVAIRGLVAEDARVQEALPALPEHEVTGELTLASRVDREAKAEQSEANTAETCECSRPAGHPDAPDCYNVETVTPDVLAQAPDVCGPRPVDRRIICILPKGHPGGHSDGTDDDGEWRATLRAAVRQPEPAKEPSTAERLLREEREAQRDAVKRAAEPSSAEAFARITKGLRRWSGRILADDDAEVMLSDLSLLERRMGAMRQVAQGVLETETIQPDWLKALARAALTDAPEVYTFGEVVDAFFAAQKRMKGDDRTPDLREYLVDELLSLRKRGS
jgi:hypothetical protein